jgi:hypothetical protein
MVRLFLVGEVTLADASIRITNRTRRLSRERMGWCCTGTGTNMAERCEWTPPVDGSADIGHLKSVGVEEVDCRADAVAEYEWQDVSYLFRELDGQCYQIILAHTNSAENANLYDLVDMCEMKFLLLLDLARHHRVEEVVVACVGVVAIVAAETIFSMVC